VIRGGRREERSDQGGGREERSDQGRREGREQ